jgi:AcrR family transcriptional regulator
MVISAEATRRQSSPFNRGAQHEAKRQEILSQAARLFNSKGSRATTLKDIAESLGLTKTSLYYYVKTKEDLVYQCYMAALEHHHAQLDNIEEKHSAPGARCGAYFLQHFDNWLAAREGRGPHIAALLEVASLKGEHRREVEIRYIELFQRLRGYLQAGIEDGSFRPCEPTATTRAILGSVEWTFFWLRELPPEQVAATAREAMDILTHGLYQGRGEYRPSSFELPGDDAAKLRGFNREEQNRLKQEAFYKTGTRFFNRQGFNGTSLDEIAEKLNVSKGAFYYHIRNKEDLLRSCYEYSLDIMENIYDQSAKISGSGLQKVERTCRHTFRVQNSTQGPLIRYNSITALPRKVRESIVDRTEQANEYFARFIREGIDDGSVRPINPFVARNLIAGATNAAMDLKQFRSIDDVDSAAIDYFDIFFNGLLRRE